MARRIALTAILLATGCTSSEAPPPAPTTTAPPPTPPVTEAPTTTSTTPPPPAPTATTGPLPVVARRPAPQPALPPQTPTSSSAPSAPEPGGVPPAGAVVSGAGKASWYARGTTTASGERFDPDGLSAAHRTLAFGTRLRVCRPAGEPCVGVVVNDRGPALWTGREIDLSRGAFATIAPLGAGVVDVIWTEAA